ncbi:DUF2842 domain-containing protein [Pleomorphomonas diazotrophica]|uniref:DUF2842 domain-containing protein n=1 Tax=Pleomorphomonas diazotrophica TaxID=1166257 RepID=A0A1I4QZ47_9HYPH|nr:DUF2842 domain-containing protein [Pleomorphomonas diazotrophica]PKR90316.1 DUF2842 domain-containing protein [Pleomorphomonas diazotrophica]SFM45309.1 Protein of unknown function [Pleomorphomonas diazotrophica]
MSPSLRKLLGTIILVITVPIYALIAMVVAVAMLPGVNFWWQLVYYLLAGLLWVPPAGLLIAWMARADRRV